jgi:hypothetical protein
MFGLSQVVENVQITPGWGKCSDYPRVGEMFGLPQGRGNYPRVEEITHRVGEMFGLPQDVGNVPITPE